MKLGLLPHIADERDIELSAVFASSPIAALPDAFGVQGLDWGMLGNEEWGDCYWASAAHEVMAQAHLAGRAPTFDTQGVLHSYAAYLGFPDGDLTHQRDRGTEPRSGAKFRQAHGVCDASGHGHRIGAYVFESEPDYGKLLSALHMFGALTLCFELPRSVEDYGQDVWDYVEGSAILGGHAVAGVARAAESGRIVIVSWGKEIEVTEGFIEKYLQVAMAYVSGSVLDGTGHTPEGLDKAALLDALKALA